MKDEAFAVFINFYFYFVQYSVCLNVTKTYERPFVRSNGTWYLQILSSRNSAKQPWDQIILSRFPNSIQRNLGSVRI